MSGPFQILIVGSDPQIAAECEAALASLAGEGPVLYRATDSRQAVEIARSRRPQLAILEMGSDLSRLKAAVTDVAAVSPETLVAACFRPELFGHDVSESALLIEALRCGVRDFLRRPISAVDLGQLVDRFRRQGSSGPARWGKVVAFISNKGGVGKSTLAVNTALGLALRYPERVLLIDTSLQMGVCATMLDVEPALSLIDAARERDRLDEMLIRQLATPHSSGLHLLAAPPDAVVAAEVDDDLISRVLTLSRRAYDYVIVDTFPVFDGVAMAVVDSCDQAYIVLENVVPTLLGIGKLLGLLDAVGFPRDRQRIVINRYIRHSGCLKPADVAQRLGRDVDHVVPYSRGMIAAANLGRPYAGRGWGFSRCASRLNEIVESVMSIASPELNGKAARSATAEAEPQV
ncbi:MAG TPA: AAA family ATPase [Planctomycetaceae bacterium]|jgi:pilus assembly protein CpaE|nr:AAA family ATPase [Planctomycetaceae bacterium]